MNSQDLIPKSMYDRAYGVVYVIQFSSGTVKVGCTRKPKKRLATHADSAVMLGGSIIQSWVSDWHFNYKDSERALIAGARAMASRALSQESFDGVDFEAAVAIAQALPKRIETRAEFTERKRREKESGERLMKLLVEDIPKVLNDANAKPQPSIQGLWDKASETHAAYEGRGRRPANPSQPTTAEMVGALWDLHEAFMKRFSLNPHDAARVTLSMVEKHTSLTLDGFHWLIEDARKNCADEPPN